MIHHGVPDVPFRDTDAAKAALGLGDRQVISTFGLINSGKGLEYAIEAMRDVAAQHPEALYLILGQTHPVVRRHEGEVYRESLEKLVAEYGLGRQRPARRSLSRLRRTRAAICKPPTSTSRRISTPCRSSAARSRMPSGSAKPSSRRRICMRKNCSRTGAGFLVEFRDARVDREHDELAARGSRSAREHRTPRLPLRPADDVAARRARIRPASSPRCCRTAVSALAHVSLTGHARPRAGPSSTIWSR